MQRLWVMRTPVARSIIVLVALGDSRSSLSRPVLSTRIATHGVLPATVAGRLRRRNVNAQSIYAPAARLIAFAAN